MILRFLAAVLLVGVAATWGLARTIGGVAAGQVHPPPPGGEERVTGEDHAGLVADEADGALGVARGVPDADREPRHRHPLW